MYSSVELLVVTLSLSWAAFPDVSPGVGAAFWLKSPCLGLHLLNDGQDSSRVLKTLAALLLLMKLFSHL